jgi:hypothetical protein
LGESHINLIAFVKYQLLHAYITCSPFSLLSLGLLLYRSEHPIREMESPRVNFLSVLLSL